MKDTKKKIMKKINIKNTFTLAVLLLALKSFSYTVTVEWHLNNLISPPLNGFPQNSSVPLYKIATISSDASCSDPFEYTQNFALQINTSRNDMFITSTPMQLYAHSLLNGPFDASLTTPIATGAGALFVQNRSIAICNQTNRKIEIWFGFNLNTTTSNCQNMQFIISIFDVFDNPTNSSDSRLYFSNYATNWTEWNTPDLFVKDNDNDYGKEPNWQNNAANITKSVSILNKLDGVAFKSWSGLNPKLLQPNYAQRSTLGSYNTLNVWVENKGCAASTSTANLNVYWSVARLWERWGSDWHNYSTYASSANSTNNFTNWTNPTSGSIEIVPLGNHITLQDKDNYFSSGQTVTIPSGLTYTVANSNNQWGGGHLSSIEWNPPNANWYTSSSTIFRNAGRPVLCYLAVIDETSKTNNGFYQNFAPNSNTSILDYASLNNNVATVNSYLATPSNLYKTALPNNKFRSEIGVIRIDNPIGLPSLPISIKLNSGEIDFRDNGAVYAIFDEVLWERWGLVNYTGTGFEIISPQVVKITNQYQANFNGISLSETESGMLGIQFEYDGNNAPEEDYNFHLSVGLYDTLSQSNQIGTPTHFNTNVFDTPAIDTSEILYKTYLENENNTNFDFLNIYPNPVNDKLNIMFELKNDADLITIEVYDLQLKLIKKTIPMDKNKGGKMYTISTDDLANGSYLLKINVDNSYQTYKFVK